MASFRTSPAALLVYSFPPSRVAAVRRAAVFCCASRSFSSHPPSLQNLVCRRQCLLLLALSPATLPSPARSEDIPLFGLRKRIKKIEEEAEEIVAEGEKAVEKGIEAAEKEIQAAEEGIVASAGLGIASDLLQAASLAGAEAVGVLVGVSVVNGILAPERKK